MLESQLSDRSVCEHTFALNSQCHESMKWRCQDQWTMLDARSASALRKIIMTISFKRKVSVEEQRVQKHNRFLRGRHIAYIIYDHFQANGAYDAAQGLTDLFKFCFQNDDVQDFDARWDQFLLVASKLPLENVPGGLQESVARFRTTSNCVGHVQPGIESRQSNAEPSKTEDCGERHHIDQMIRTRNFKARKTSAL